MSTVTIGVGEIVIGRYEIISYLGAGGMQWVYMAFDNILNRTVVLKTPKESVKDRRFKRGAEMGARINHPNVAATFDYYEDDKTTFLIEEYVAGKDLGWRLDNDFHFLDPALAAHTVNHIARALYEAHKVGICHRDLKPSNIMVSEDESLSSIKLTDFGIAKLAESEIEAEMEKFDNDPATLTTSNTLLGAVPYLAPECWDNWRSAGQPSDIWALGCIIYHLLTGLPPFGIGRKAIAKVMESKFSGVKLAKPSWFGAHRSTERTEEQLWRLIQSCIQVDPNLRPKAKEVIESCVQLCYPASQRHRGVVDKFPGNYGGGGARADWGFLAATAFPKGLFFHGAEFFGAVLPKNGQAISFSAYTGSPKPRACPVLLVRARN